MAFGGIKATFAISVAVMFGILQIICACLSTDFNLQNASTVHAQATMIHHVVGSDTHSNQATPASILSAPCHSEQDDPNRVENCAHCDGNSLLSAEAELPSAAQTGEIDPPSKILMANALPSPPRAGMAPSALSGLRWRDPPTPTPVTLNTVALI